MPKLVCPCGYIHDLSPVPDDGFVVLRDRDYERVREAEQVAQRLGDSSPGSPGWSELSDADALIVRLTGRMYECPTCGRLMWLRGSPGEDLPTIYRRE